MFAVRVSSGGGQGWSASRGGFGSFARAFEAHLSVRVDEAVLRRAIAPERPAFARASIDLSQMVASTGCPGLTRADLQTTLAPFA